MAFNAINNNYNNISNIPNITVGPELKKLFEQYGIQYTPDNIQAIINKFPNLKNITQLSDADKAEIGNVLKNYSIFSSEHFDHGNDKIGEEGKNSEKTDLEKLFEPVFEKLGKDFDINLLAKLSNKTVYQLNTMPNEDREELLKILQDDIKYAQSSDPAVIEKTIMERQKERLNNQILSGLTAEGLISDGQELNNRQLIDLSTKSENENTRQTIADKVVSDYVEKNDTEGLTNAILNGSKEFTSTAAQKMTYEQFTSTILDNIEKRCDELLDKINNATTDDERNRLQEELNSYASTIANLQTYKEQGNFTTEQKAEIDQRLSDLARKYQFQEIVTRSIAETLLNNKSLYNEEFADRMNKATDGKFQKELDNLQEQHSAQSKDGVGLNQNKSLDDVRNANNKSNEIKKQIGLQGEDKEIKGTNTDKPAAQAAKPTESAELTTLTGYTQTIIRNPVDYMICTSVKTVTAAVRATLTRNEASKTTVDMAKKDFEILDTATKGSILAEISNEDTFADLINNMPASALQNLIESGWKASSLALTQMVENRIAEDNENNPNENFFAQD